MAASERRINVLCIFKACERVCRTLLAGFFIELIFITGDTELGAYRERDIFWLPGIGFRTAE
jgi:hypothetical protein